MPVVPRIFAYKFATETHVFLATAGRSPGYIAAIFPSLPYIAPMTHKFPSSERGAIRSIARAAAFCLLATTLAPNFASATLGEESATVDKDVTRLHAQRSVTPSTAYSMHELQLPGGTRVREYSSANRVFAVTWSGPSIPDLQQLLGTAYFPRYSTAVKALRGARRPLAVEESDLVIHTGGHPRAFFGIAYLPTQMPSGLRAEQIR
jgi:Protein of unknown function (DUF2844)